MNSDNRKVAVITGANGAVGRAAAGRLAAARADLVLVDREADATAQLAHEIERDHGVAARAVCVDLLDPDAIEHIRAEVENGFGRLDVLVNNAGASGAAKLEFASRAEWDKVLAINLTVPMLLCQAALPFWKSQAGGRVVNVGSRVWQSGSGLAYTSSKAGLVGLTRSLAVQLGPLNVTVNAVAPSYLSTASTPAASDVARAKAVAGHLRLGVLGRLGTPADVAAAIAFLASDDAGFITGEILHVAGGAQLAARPLEG